MPNTKEIKNRINSIKNTQKITNAMYLISSTKMRRAKEELDKARPYFELTGSEIKKLVRQAGKVTSRYFYPETGRKPAETYAYLVITADKGLAGGYNHNVLKAAEEEMRKHKKVILYVVGEYGRQYFQKRNIPIAKSFLYTAQNPTFRRAREIANVLLDIYDDPECDEIRVIYSNMAEMDCVVEKAKLLPFDRPEDSAKFIPGHGSEVRGEVKVGDTKAGEGNIRKEYDFFPSADAVIDSIVPSYVAGFIYGALVNSFCSEQNARMTAMKSANDNAEALLGDLSVQYNRVRQAAITQEITEVAAGAKAQKNKRKREADPDA